MLYGEPKTTFWQDFTIADTFGIGAIKDTYKRAFDEWHENTEYITELVVVLNHKLWQHYERGDERKAKLYNELWQKADSWCMEHLQGEDLRYYFNVTD